MPDYLLYDGNAHAIFFTGGAINLETGEEEYFTSQIPITIRLQDANEVDVAGVTWPVSLNYITNSQGRFVALLPDTVVIDRTQEYIGLGHVDAGSGATGTWKLPVHVLGERH